MESLVLLWWPCCSIADQNREQVGSPCLWFGLKRDAWFWYKTCIKVGCVSLSPSWYSSRSPYKKELCGFALVASNQWMPLGEFPISPGTTWNFSLKVTFFFNDHVIYVLFYNTVNHAAKQPHLLHLCSYGLLYCCCWNCYYYSVFSQTLW